MGDDRPGTGDKRIYWRYTVPMRGRIFILNELAAILMKRLIFQCPLAIALVPKWNSLK
jgi:hypothetical protein